MERDSISRLDSDVLVIGGGGGGLRAAIEAGKHGMKVILVSKSRVGYKNNTAIAGGGLAVAAGWGNSKDSPQTHFKDTVVAGCYLNDRKLVETLVTGCEQQVYDLVKFGVSFQKKIQTLQFILYQDIAIHECFLAPSEAWGLPSP